MDIRSSDIHFSSTAIVGLMGIEADIEALRLTGRYVRKVLADWEQQIQSAGPGQQSHLLYSLGDAVKKAGAPVDRFRRKKRQ